MNDPLAHIARPSVPWRPDHEVTECGKPTVDFAKVITSAEAVTLWKKHGAQRAAFLLCMTCVNTTNRHGHRRTSSPSTWANDPIEVARRYLSRVEWQDGPERDRVEKELRALGALVDAHRDEFDGFVAGLSEVADLATRRKGRAS